MDTPFPISEVVVDILDIPITPTERRLRALRLLGDNVPPPFVEPISEEDRRIFAPNFWEIDELGGNDERRDT